MYANEVDKFIITMVAAWRGALLGTGVKSAGQDKTTNDLDPWRIFYPVKQFWRCEIEELRKTINKTEAQLRHFIGEDIELLGLKELKQLERQLKTGAERIRSKKKRAISEHVSLLKSKLSDLQKENARLQKRLELKLLLLLFFIFFCLYLIFGVKLHELPDANVSSRIPEANECDAFHQRR
ncbi:hypothetical protein DKX38_022904 [Salix brachista]|uniref:K-box domain-containing protein n=1 Tax=Salix brachista TaxID=2182728 RepID=A0A5N5K6G5_9ROSI|nr:hypothetical protein DKX38_022904 [Salix brachista]